MVRSGADQFRTMLPALVRVIESLGSAAPPWLTAALSNWLERLVTCCQLSEPVSAPALIVTPDTEVCAGVGPLTGAEPLRTLVALFVVVTAEAGVAPTSPDTREAAPTHVAANAARNR